MSETFRVTLNPDAAPDPVYVLEVAEAAAEAVRVLNRLTLHHEALHYPSEAYGLIQHLAAAAGRLPQLLGQVSRWLAAEQAAGRVTVTEGEDAGRPDMAAVAALMRLDEAQALARCLQEALDGAAGHTAVMGAPEPGDGSEKAGGG